MASTSQGAVCLICRTAIVFSSKDSACVGRKGLETINEFTLKHNKLNPENRLPLYEFDVKRTLYVHNTCRKSHTNSRRYEQCKRKHSEDSIQDHRLRSETIKFSFHTGCFLCGMYVDRQMAVKRPNNPDYEYSQAMLLDVKNTITERCADRSDEWSDAVLHRLACVHDLPAEEAIYHRRCFQYFMSPRNLTLDPLSTFRDRMPAKKRGRPSGTMNDMKKSAFMHAIDYLENNDDETITLDELYDVMEKQATSDEVYSKKSLQNHLYAYYGDRVSITSSNQQPLIVTLTENVKQLIQDAHEKFKQNCNDIDAMITIVGNHIRNEIKKC